MGRLTLPTKALHSIFSLLVIGAVLAPISENWKAEPRDNFPLSYYPMFSSARDEIASVNYLVGWDEDGTRYRIHYRFVGTGGMNQVRRQLNRQVARGDAQLACQNTAREIARRGRTNLSEVVRVDVMTGRYRLAAYFDGDQEPEAEQVRASCQVQR